MNKERVQTDTFDLKKHNLRIYRVTEPGTAVVLWTSEPQAIRYVQRLHIWKLTKLKRRC